MIKIIIKYIQGNITNELKTTRSFKVKDIYNNYYNPYFHGRIKGSLNWPLLFLQQADARDCSGGLNEHKCPC